MIKQKIWRVRQADPILEYIFQHELRVSPVLARLLANRGITTVDEARLFLEGGLDQMYDPFIMADMDEAVRRIRFALSRGERILVYGDYDADGTTATALLVKVFRRLGGQVGYYVPHRVDEGYGLHPEALRRAGREGYGLVVTVDCGISALEEVALNRAEKGPDIVITDHHEPPGEIPGAVAVVNPKRADCPYQFKELAGVGIALKLAQALLRDRGREADAWTDYLDLACLGTVADIVPLAGENRIIVKYGLAFLAQTESLGIKSLMGISGTKAESLGAREVGFALVPRLNAAGRVGNAAMAVDLFLTEDPGEAGQLADLLNRGNQERQKIESLVLAEALGMLDANPDLYGGKVIVLAAPGWHQGVVGIVASRLVDKYYKPVLMIALEGDKGKGSGRSIPGFHLFNALSHCADLLIRFGGHEQAAGFSISADNVDSLRRALNQYAGQFIDAGIYVRGMELDATISLKDITDGLVEEIQMMAPFGHCNPGPLLACREVKVVSCRGIGKNGQHLKMLLKENGTFLDGIAFKFASSAGEIAAASEVDVAFLPSVNEWGGRRTLQLEVKDIRPSVNNWERCGPLYSGSPGDIPGMDLQEALESLKKMGPLAHLPEFLSGILSRYREISANFMFPGNYLDFFSERISASVNQTEDQRRMMNERNSSFKPAGLINLTGGSKESLVLVNSPGRAVELAAFLTRSGVAAASVHSGSLSEGVSALADAFSSGQLQVLVCTYPVLYFLDIKPINIILYDLPFSPGEAAGAFSGGVETHVLFGGKDLDTGFEYVESLAPGRARLAELYTYLNRCRGAGYIDWEGATAYLRGCGLAQAGLHTLAFGMAVFSDLGLISCRQEENGYSLSLAPVNRKRDLNLSPTFRLGQEIKISTEKWWRSLSGQNPA